MRRRTTLALLATLMLVASACSSDSSEPASSDESADGSSTSTSGSPASDQSSDPSDDAASSDIQETEPATGGVGDHFDTAGGVATVTIGDETWDFMLPEGHPVAACDADFFGGFVAGLTTGGADIAEPADWMSVALPGGDFTDPPAVTVKLAVSGEAEWIADETIYEQNTDLPAGLGVTSFAIDGTTASGTATFFEQESFYQFNAGNGDLVIADGTFTVTCVAE